jgi:predicted amidophosphoribosyltransferase
VKRLRSYKPLPQRAVCKRCEKPFTYGRTTKPRLYCAPCVEKERKENNDFFNAKAREERHRARLRAFLVHVEMEHAA